MTIEIPQESAEAASPAFEILQPGVGETPGAHYLRATPDTVLWGRLPCVTDAAVLTIATGDTVTIDTVSHEGILDDQGKNPVRFFGGHGVAASAVLDDAIAIAATVPRDAASDGPHVVTGPIRIDGAKPGDLLKITVERLQPRVPYGVISNRHGKGALVGELPRTPGSVSVFAAVEERDGRLVGTLPVTEGGERIVTFPLAPFLGMMGVAVAESERPHSVPPGAHGGNIDINLLVEGTVLYLPVQVDGALAYIGDPHFAQGDGEVALTALEASLRATLRFDVVPREEALAEFGEVTGPLVRTDEYLVPTGLDLDLDEAMRRCVRAALSLIQARWGMDEHLAYAYLSAATDFDISQVVDIVSGVHARIRESDFADVPRPARPAPASGSASGTVPVTGSGSVPGSASVPRSGESTGTGASGRNGPVLATSPEPGTATGTASASVSVTGPAPRSGESTGSGASGRNGPVFATSPEPGTATGTGSAFVPAPRSGESTGTGASGRNGPVFATSPEPGTATGAGR